MIKHSLLLLAARAWLGRRGTPPANKPPMGPPPPPPPPPPDDDPPDDTSAQQQISLKHNHFIHIMHSIA